MRRMGRAMGTCSGCEIVLLRGLPSGNIWIRWAACVGTIEGFEEGRDDAGQRTKEWRG